MKKIILLLVMVFAFNCGSYDDDGDEAKFWILYYLLNSGNSEEQKHALCEGSGSC